jgi:hypothetical protein
VQNTTAGLLAMLANLIAGCLEGAKVGLFTGTPTLSLNSQISDFAEPLYTGYARKPITWNPVFVNSGGQVQVDSGLMQFQPSSGTPSDLVTGFFVTDSAGTTLLFAGVLATPVSFVSAKDAVPVVVQYTMG